MLTIRRFRKSDAQQVGVLIADTYKEFNLSELTLAQQKAMLGPFLHARSMEPSHQQAIADGSIVGVLRGGRVDGLGRTVL